MRLTDKDDIRDFSLITHSLPESVEVNGREYLLNTRTVKALQAISILTDEEVPAYKRIDEMFALLVRNCDAIKDEDAADLERELLAYLGGYPKVVSGQPKSKEVISYIQDHDLIISSFREAYGFTLDDIRGMHWWLFLAYMNGLPSTTRLASVIQIRLTEVTSKDSPEAKRAKIQAKRAVALRPRKRSGSGEDGYDIVSRGIAAGD